VFDAVVPDAREAASGLRRIEGVRDVSFRRDGEWTVFTIEVPSGSDPRESLFRHAVENSWRVREISRPPVSLERVFAEVTSPEEETR
jgi:hypothetical protein